MERTGSRTFGAEALALLRKAERAILEAVEAEYGADLQPAALPEHRSRLVCRLGTDCDDRLSPAIVGLKRQRGANSRASAR